MPTVSVDADAYQDLDQLRQRIDYDGGEFFDDNVALRFDELLVQLERESRGIFETLWGDESPLTETGRVDELRPTDDAAIPLAYPITDVTQVEYKITQTSDWTVLDSDWYDHTAHRLVLARRPNTNSLRYSQRGNTATAFAQRATWNFAAKLRVTYDRGFGSKPPADIQNIQTQLITNALHSRRADQTTAAASPEELASATSQSEMLTADLRARISDVTSPGYATFSV